MITSKTTIMRIGFFLTLLYLGMSVSAQTKKDTKITVRVQDTTGVFNKITMLLYERGYNIQRKDEALKVISTDEKSWGSASAKYRFIIKDSSVVISGDVASNISLALGVDRHFQPIFFGGMKGSDLRTSWNEMLALAKKIGEDISYSK